MTPTAALFRVRRASRLETLQRIHEWPMKFVVPAVVALALATLCVEDATAQPYCAMYENGTRACGIPTLDSCNQSLVGVGGVCELDQTNQIPPNLMQRWRRANPNQEEILHPPDPSQDQPGGLNWMPPPPGQ